MGENSYTYKITGEQGEALKKILKAKDFEFKKLEYGFFSAAKGKCRINYYESGKLLLQGKDAKDFIVFTLEPEVLHEARLGYEEELNPRMFQPHFGIDESGKGDFFGPLVVAGVYVDPVTARQLLDSGVKDSKRIKSDQKALDLSDAIKKIVGKNHWDVVEIGSTRYNELYKKIGNLNDLLAWAHGKVIENLHQKEPSCPRTLSDQFAKPSLIRKELQKKKIDLELEQRTKAEDDIAVAAASLVARAHFIKKIQDIGNELDMNILKGASEAVKELGFEIAKAKGVDFLRSIVKEHFKTFEEIQRKFT